MIYYFSGNSIFADIITFTTSRDNAANVCVRTSRGKMILLTFFGGGWQSLYTRIRTLRGSHPPDAYIYFNRHIISQQSIMATLPNYILGDKLPQPAGGKLCAGGVLLPFLTYSTSGIIITKYIPLVE